MHPKLTRELLAAEVEAVRTIDALSHRTDYLERAGSAIHVTCTPVGRAPVRLTFDGRRYDLEPLSLIVCDPDTGTPLDQAGWGALFHSIHPVLGRPFCCIRGLLEYHLHPSHISDPWELHRATLTFPTLLGHILAKAGVP